jgi:predicted histone-like DNA-binding protein
MEIKYRIVEKMLPPSVGNGKESKYYMVVNSKGEMDLERITELVMKRCSVHGSDIRSVIYALTEVAIEGLQDGYIVRLGELGSLRMILNSEGRDSPEQVNHSAVKNCKIHFAPGKKLKDIRKDLVFKKMG